MKCRLSVDFFSNDLNYSFGDIYASNQIKVIYSTVFQRTELANRVSWMIISWATFAMPVSELEFAQGKSAD